MQGKLLTSEQQFRPQYNELNLQDLQQYLLGSGGIPGALDLFKQSSISAANTQSGANRIQREADINDVLQLGGAATQAFRNANPELQAQLSRAQGLAGSGDPYAGLRGAIAGNQQQPAIGRGLLGESLYGQAMNANGLGQVGQSLDARALELSKSTGALTPDELRSVQQDIRGAYSARGTEMGSGAISAEALGRLTNERQKMQQDLGLAAALNQGNQAELGANRAFQSGVYGQDLGLQSDNREYANRFGQQQISNYGMLGQAEQSRLGQDRSYALQLAQMQAAIAADPFQAILGRQSGALQYGAGQQGFAGGLTQSMQGPQLFNPDTGINLALQNASNLGNYQAATYGARAGAQGAMMGGLFQGLGALGGGFLSKCHVAREVYGETNPKWFDFFIWKEFHAPAWFRWLYNKFSVQVAAFIRPFPRLKNLIRLWMDKKIKEL